VAKIFVRSKPSCEVWNAKCTEARGQEFSPYARTQLDKVIEIWSRQAAYSSQTQRLNTDRAEQDTSDRIGKKMTEIIEQRVHKYGALFIGVLCCRYSTGSLIVAGSRDVYLSRHVLNASDTKDQCHVTIHVVLVVVVICSLHILLSKVIHGSSAFLNFITSLPGLSIRPLQYDISCTPPESQTFQAMRTEQTNKRAQSY